MPESAASSARSARRARENSVRCAPTVVANWSHAHDAPLSSADRHQRTVPTKGIGRCHPVSTAEYPAGERPARTGSGSEIQAATQLDENEPSGSSDEPTGSVGSRSSSSRCWASSHDMIASNSAETRSGSIAATGAQVSSDVVGVRVEGLRSRFGRLRRHPAGRRTGRRVTTGPSTSSSRAVPRAGRRRRAAAQRDVGHEPGRVRRVGDHAAGTLSRSLTPGPLCVRQLLLHGVAQRLARVGDKALVA